MVDQITGEYTFERMRDMRERLMIDENEFRCEQVRFEYENVEDYAKRPNETRGRTVHPLGKNDQLLASTIVSKGTKNGSALVSKKL